MKKVAFLKKKKELNSFLKIHTNKKIFQNPTNFFLERKSTAYYFGSTKPTTKSISSDRVKAKARFTCATIKNVTDIAVFFMSTQLR